MKTTTGMVYCYGILSVSAEYKTILEWVHLWIAKWNPALIVRLKALSFHIAS